MVFQRHLVMFCEFKKKLLYIMVLQLHKYKCSHAMQLKYTHDILAEEAMRCGDDPARGNQSACAEVWLSNVNGCHPGVSTWQGRASTHYPAPGNWYPLLVLLPTYRLSARLRGSWFFNTRQWMDWDYPSSSYTRTQIEIHDYWTATMFADATLQQTTKILL